MEKINLQNPCFDEMKVELNASIEHVVRKLASGAFEGGDINLKLHVGVVAEVKEDTLYKKPSFEYRVNTTMQQKSSLDGCFDFKDQELVLDDEGNPILRHVVSNQIDMFDE